MSALANCPFCGAGRTDKWTGSVRWFACGTMTAEAVNRHDQTRQCVMGEVARLTKERDEANEETSEIVAAFGRFTSRVAAGLDSAGIKDDDIGTRVDAAIVRIKRLEDAGRQLATSVQHLHVFIEANGWESDVGIEHVKAWEKLMEDKS